METPVTLGALLKSGIGLLGVLPQTQNKQYWEYSQTWLKSGQNHILQAMAVFSQTLCVKDQTSINIYETNQNFLALILALPFFTKMMIFSCIDHCIHIQGSCHWPGLQILLDPGELLHPGHPGGDVVMLTDLPGLHQPHQVHDGVDGEVGIGRGAPKEEALITQHLHQGWELGWEDLGEELLLLLLQLVSLEDVDNRHDLDEVFASVVEGVHQGGLDWILGDEVRLGDETSEVPDNQGELFKELSVLVP